MSDSSFQSIDLDQLSTVTGGNGFWAGAARLAGGAGRLAGRLAWPITAAVAAYDGYQGYSAARAAGATVPQALGEGAQNAASGATLGLIPAPR